MKSISSGLLAGIAALALGFSSFAAQASVTYSYTGNTFSDANPPYTTSDKVTGFITLPTALAPNLTSYTTVVPTAFSFSDGVDTITNTTPGAGSQFFFKTDASGNITFWGATTYVGSTYSFSISTVNAPGVYGTYDLSQHGGGTQAGQSLNNPGTWTSAPVPEPEAGALVLAGLTLVAAAALHRKA